MNYEYADGIFLVDDGQTLRETVRARRDAQEEKRRMSGKNKETPDSEDNLLRMVIASGSRAKPGLAARM